MIGAPSPERRPRRLARALIGAVVVLAASAGSAQTSRDALWHIVSECVDTSEAAYCTRCRSPIEGACGTGRSCRQSTDVWAATSEYVAIRDLKMCGCPSQFVHGLALPRARVTGSEDPRRPAGIWAFAWDVARSRIGTERDIALAVNPPALRTQDQLHVHLVRLAPEARQKLAVSAPARVASLDEVWVAGDRAAAASGLTGYGLLVVRAEPGPGFLVVVDAGSPEYDFTVPTCR